MLGITADQIPWAIAGLLFILLISVSWTLSKHKAFNRGYETGTHDREHWETDAIVRGKLERP
jgi:hypothetical protein